MVLSPNVFWWRDGHWTQVTRQGPDGAIRVINDSDLVGMIRHLEG
jgi:hypothetical protein